MQLEAVTVCVGYADFLQETIRWNKPYFDRWVIVTSPDDAKTRELCRKYSLPCVLSEDHKREPPFNKGRLIRRGLDLLSHRGWVLHIDGDIALPGDFRNLLESAHLDDTCIYGADRIMVHGCDAWDRLVATAWLRQSQNYHCRVWVPEGFSIGDRWADLHHGYVPIGYFQLWHGAEDLQQGIHTKPYPSHHNDAARGDVQHGLQWDRRKRCLLPEVMVAHLDSGKSRLGANWKGRTTPLFRPESQRPPSGPKCPS